MDTFKTVVYEASSDQEIIDCHQTIVELRPHLKNENEYISQVRRQQANDNYRLIYTRDENGKVVSILGFRVHEWLSTGRTLYIADFATLKTARRSGYGHCLMKWIMDYAKQIKCTYVSLESRHERKDAHRFYLNHGFVIVSHHFEFEL